MTLPPWISPRADDLFRPEPPAPRGLRRRTMVRRALNSFARTLEDLLSNEGISAQQGLLQGLEARAKVLGLLGMILVVTWVHHLTTLAVAFLACLGLAAVSRIPLSRLGRTWLAVPLFSAAIVVPAMLNLVTPGQPLLLLWPSLPAHWGPWSLPPFLAITDAGLAVAGRFILRTTNCVTLALLLTATTPAASLFRGLRALGVPKLIVMLLSMMERYLSVLLRAAQEVHLAKLSRSIAAGTLRQEQAWVAAGMGALFRRTHALGNAVYLAMLSRGYTGEIYLLDEPRWRLRDGLFLGGTVALGALLLLLG